MAKNKKHTKSQALKVEGAIARQCVSNINQKAQIFAHKGTKRKKTRQTQKDAAINESDS